MLLFVTGIPFVALTVMVFAPSPTRFDPGLEVGRSEYHLGQMLWWLIFPLAVASLPAALLVMYGRTPWPAVAAATGWFVLAVLLTAQTGDPTILVPMGFTAVLLWSGTVARTHTIPR